MQASFLKSAAITKEETGLKKWENSGNMRAPTPFCYVSVLLLPPGTPRGVVRRLFKSRHNMLEERNVRVTVPNESFYGRGEKTHINVKNLTLRK